MADKPVRYNPEKMSFQEKLALHRKTLEQQGTQTSTAHRPPARPSSAREGNRRPVLPELGVNRTSSAEAPAKGKGGRGGGGKGWKVGEREGERKINVLLHGYVHVCTPAFICMYFTVLHYHSPLFLQWKTERQNQCPPSPSQDEYLPCKSLRASQVGRAV